MALTNGSIASTIVAISIFSFLDFAGSSRTCRSLVEVAGGRSSLEFLHITEGFEHTMNNLKLTPPLS